MPLLTGLLLLGAGLLLRRWQPSALNLPEADDRPRHSKGVRRAATGARDGVAKVLPGNLTGSIGRSLIIMGAGLVLVRALDAVADDEDALF
jgi:hypothetical protein